MCLLICFDLYFIVSRLLELWDFVWIQTVIYTLSYPGWCGGVGWVVCCPRPRGQNILYKALSLGLVNVSEWFAFVTFLHIAMNRIKKIGCFHLRILVEMKITALPSFLLYTLPLIFISANSTNISFFLPFLFGAVGKGRGGSCNNLTHWLSHITSIVLVGCSVNDCTNFYLHRLNP